MSAHAQLGGEEGLVEQPAVCSVRTFPYRYSAAAMSSSWRSRFCTSPAGEDGYMVAKATSGL